MEYEWNMKWMGMYWDYNLAYVNPHVLTINNLDLSVILIGNLWLINIVLPSGNQT